MRVDAVEDFERGFVTYDPVRQQAWKPRSTAGRNPDRKKIPSQGGIDAVDAVRRGVEHTTTQARDVVGNRKIHRGRVSRRGQTRPENRPMEQAPAAAFTFDRLHNIGYLSQG